MGPAAKGWIEAEPMQRFVTKGAAQPTDPTRTRELPNHTPEMSRRREISRGVRKTAITGRAGHPEPRRGLA